MSSTTTSWAVAAAPDWIAPGVTASAVADGTGVPHVRQGGSYQLYADVSDTGAPASGVASVTADASALTAGATAAALTAGTHTVSGVGYGYGSAALTVASTVRAWRVPTSITTTDAAGNTASVGGPTAFVDRDLAADRLARIDGALAGDYIDAVIDAGDVNGDGRRDLLVSSALTSPSAMTGAGSATVIFGTATPGDVDLAGLGAAAGFRIHGPAAGANLGWSAAAVGDVNDDGLADVALAAPYAPYLARGQVGATYVIFGKTSTSTVDTAALGSAGYVIGGASGDRLGSSIANAGDVNADGRSDLVIGCRSAGGGQGRALVVFSHATTTAIDAAALGTDGYVIDGVASTAGLEASLGSAVADAGDVNADGVPDQLIAAPGSELSGRTDAGSVFVVFGQRPGLSAISLAALGAGGYRIDGAVADDQLGGEKFYQNGIAGVGDLNGDAVPDHLIGAPYADPSGRANAGRAYVVHGKATATTIDTATMNAAATAAGFRIDGSTVGGKLGTTVGRGLSTSTGAGTDIDRDGRADVIVVAPNGNPGGRAAAGVVYVIRGALAPAAVDLATPGSQAYLVAGAAAGDKARLVVVIGDRNGDTHPDLAITAGDASPSGRVRAGTGYLIAG